MAHIRKHPVTGKPQVRWRDPAGKEKTKSFSRATDARAYKTQIEHELQRGLYIDRVQGKTPFEQCAAEWLDGKIDLRRSSWCRDETYLRNHVVSTFGRTPIAAITKSNVQAWIGELQAKGLAPGTIKHCYRILRSILDEVVDKKMLGESPCRRIALPRIERQEQLYLEPEEVSLLASAINPHFRALVLSAAYLGCRWGELAGLKRGSLDLQGRSLTIVGSLEEVAGLVRYVQETKTKSSRRALTIPPFLCHILGQHLAEAPVGEFVFASREGQPLRRNNFRRRHWKPALIKAGLPQGLRFHDLRHTCASILIAQGAHPKEIQARLGHSSITTTMDRYGHLLPSLGSQLDEALDRTYRHVQIVPLSGNSTPEPMPDLGSIF